MNQIIIDKVTELRHLLHQYPELSCQERETKCRLMTFLKDNTSLKLVDQGSWFYAVKEYVSGNGDSNKAPIAFRADYDALPIEEHLGLPYDSKNPGVSHKCGHDGHASTLCGVAMAVDQMSFDRTIYLVFQPAEEIGLGGEACAKFLEKEGVGEVYAFHNRSGYPEGTVVVRDGLTQCASVGLTVTFTGKTCHASEPEHGISPALVMAKLVAYASTLDKSCLQDMVLLTVIDISLGNMDFGVSPGQGSVSFTLRANEEEDLKAVKAMILADARDLARTYGLETNQEEHDYFPETRNVTSAVEKVRAAARSNGYPCLEMKEPWRASEDFGYYTKHIKGAMFYMGNGEDYPPLHTAGFDYNDKIIDRTIQMFLSLI